MKNINLRTLLVLSTIMLNIGFVFGALPYTIVDTNQTTCYGDTASITCPSPGQPFYGQDAQYTGNQPSYTTSGDGLTVYDNNTGLTWTQTPDLDGDGEIDADDKLTYSEASTYDIILNTAEYGGFDDWRLPTIKELYSLMDFNGVDPSGYNGSDTSWLTPFIDDNYFDVGFGDTNANERIIDGQYCTSTIYAGTVMNQQQAMMGLNLIDGRIKGYPTNNKTFYVYFVRGNTDYGVNDFVDNADGTVTDLSTGLMWQQDDSVLGKDFQDALDYAENLSLAGHDDWRLPNAKELHSILDYSRSPATDGTAAIDPVFNCTGITDEEGGSDFPFYWSSTTHVNMSANNYGRWAAYLCFGTAYGYMTQPVPPFTTTFMDVHGAGAQRSDPKYDDGTDYSSGHGPQGDVVRIYNHVRCVRDVELCGDNEHPFPIGDIT